MHSRTVQDAPVPRKVGQKKRLVKMARRLRIRARRLMAKHMALRSVPWTRARRSGARQMARTRTERSVRWRHRRSRTLRTRAG